MSPLATPRSAIEEGDEAASSAAAAERVDLPGGSRRVDLSAAQSSYAPKATPRSLFEKLSGPFPSSHHTILSASNRPLQPHFILIPRATEHTESMRTCSRHMHKHLTRM